MPVPDAILPTLTGPDELKSMSLEDLERLAGEIRERIIEQVSATGGHLAPNLGVVELTLALHRVFDFGWDRLLFDVGHQCYPHKLITGRAGLLPGLRTSEGMSGFPEPSESAYDLFRVGHAGTGVSTAVGMARGDQLSGEGYDPKGNAEGRRVVTLVGDASIVNGLAMEGLNSAGTLKRQMLVVLNDNGMSISRPQGAVAGYFDRLRVSHLYTDFKKGARRVLENLPGGSLIQEAYHKAGEATKAMIAEGAWFEHFGLLTVGPVDGHDLPTLIEFLTEARDMDRPMVLHVKTVKGKGLAVAERDATCFHSPPAFTVEQDEREGTKVALSSKGRSFTAAVADALVGMMERDEHVVACTAAMPDGTGVVKAIERFPERAWDTGICESHAMDMMAGLAKTGYKPFFAVYSTFLQRAFDQAFQEVSLQGLPVRLLLDRAGLVGGDGAVHHGFCDVTLLRSLPGACVMAAMDEASLVASLEFMRDYEEGLSSVRYPRDQVSDRFAKEPCPAFELGRARLLTPGCDGVEGPCDAVVLAFGTPAIAAVEAAELLASEYRVSVYDARFAKPVDVGLLQRVLGAGRPVVTVEDHSRVGGFGAAVLECAAELGLNASGVRVLGMPDDWVMQDARSVQLANTGLDRDGIVRAVRSAADRACADHAGTSRVGAPATERTRARSDGAIG